jgi:hypothetical protein
MRDGDFSLSGRLDMLHPSLFVSTANNKQGHQRKRRGAA